MISAAKAFQQSLTNQDDTSTIDELLDAETKIAEAVERGSFAVVLGPHPCKKAEKLAIELEEYGYCVAVSHPEIRNQEVVVAVMVNWRFLPSPSRVDKSLSEQ